MKGQIVPSATGFLAFESEDGRHHEITNCFSASIENVADYANFGHIMERVPTGERRIHAEFRVTQFVVDENPPKKDYDYDAEVVEEPPELPEGGKFLTSGPGWPD